MKTSEKVNSLRQILGAIFKSVFKREIMLVFEKMLAKSCVKIETKIEVDLKLVQDDDFPKIGDKFKKFRTNVGKMFESGNTCIVAEIHGEFVHWTWVAFNEAYVTEIGRKIRLNSGSAYMYAGYTVPEYRGLGIAPKAMGKILSYLHKRGIKKAYALIRPDNFQALRYTHKVGFKKIGMIRFIGISKLRLYRCKGETKKDYNTLIGMFSIKGGRSLLDKLLCVQDTSSC